MSIIRLLVDYSTETVYWHSFKGIFRERFDLSLPMAFLLRCLGTLFCWVAVAAATAQPTLPFRYSFQADVFASSSQRLPFWQAANQFGTRPEAGPAVVLRQGVSSLSSAKKFFYGLESVTIVGKETKLRLPEAYAGLRFGPVEVWAGRRKQVHGLVDTLLSSGSISWSGNALPLPQVTVGIPEYKPLLLNRLAIKGHFAHGWFGQQQMAEYYFLHQKSVYLRWGRPAARLKLYGGLLHHVQWGGRPRFVDTKYDPFGKFYKEGFPRDWFTYTQVVLPYKALRDTTQYNYFEISNRFGNHLGQLDVGGEVKLNRGKVLFYKQTFFETGQTFSSLSNIDDGLYGVSFQSDEPTTGLARLTLEYLHTLNQGKRQPRLVRWLGLPDRHYGEQSFYFNHAQYQDGWSYQRATIGSPFLIPQEQIRIERQNGDPAIFVNNNRVKAFYVGMINHVNAIQLTTRMSHSINYGAYTLELPPVSQTSLAVAMRFPLFSKSRFLTVGVGIDQGDLIRDNYGVQLSFFQKW